MNLPINILLRINAITNDEMRHFILVRCLMEHEIQFSRYIEEFTES